MTRAIDHGIELHQELEQIRIREVAEQASQPEVADVGRCHNCDESLGDGRRWCDEDCLEDWERRRRR